MNKCYSYPVVSIKGLCKNESPLSGLYVDSLAGVSLKRFLDVTGEEYATVKEKYKEIHDQAFKCVKDDYLYKLRDKLTLKGVIENKISGEYGSNLKRHDGWVGKKIETNTNDCLKKAKIDFVKIYSDVEIDKQFVIKDGVNEYEKTVRLNKGLNHIYFNQVIESCEAYIFFNPCNLQIGEKCDNACSKCNCNCSCACDCIIITSVISNDEGQTWVNQNNGLVVSVSCVCDPCELFCMNIQKLYTALQYKIAILLADEIILSDGTSCFIANGGKKLAEKWLMRYEGGEDLSNGFKYPPAYKIEIDKAVKYTINMVAQLDTDCIECGGYRMEQTTP